MLGVLVIAQAWSQTEVCPGPLPLAEWTQAMDAVDQALIAGDGTRADRILDQVVYDLRCLDVVAPPDLLGRLARQLALVAFFAQDYDEMGYWATLAAETAGDEPWPTELPVLDAYLALVAALPEPTVREADGGLLVPKGGGALLDGRLILTPSATEGAQHLLQLADKRGAILSTTWQTGAAFPSEALTGSPVHLTAPRWYVAPADPVPVEPDPVPVEPDPVPDPVPVEPDPVPDPVPVEPQPVPVEPDPVPPVNFDGDGKTAACPWKQDPHAVEVHGHTVQVNKRLFEVGTAADQAAFVDVLHACGEYRAARRFVKWQDARGRLFSGARGYRDAMVDALLTDEPKRKRL